MKRMLAVILLSCLLPAACLAAPEGIYLSDTPHLQLSFELVDSPYPKGEEMGPVIMRLTAPNGQSLHFVTWMTSDPVVHSADVNFDGADDLAVMVSSGATNSVYRLFVRQGERYVAVDDGQEEGLFNPVLYPELGLVESQGTSGLAGALHENILLKWEGTRLVPVRRAVCANDQTNNFQDDAYTVTDWFNILRSRVLDYTGAQYGDPLVLFDEIYNMNALGMEEDYLDFYQREQDALWQGIQEVMEPQRRADRPAFWYSDRAPKAFWEAMDRLLEGKQKDDLLEQFRQQYGANSDFWPLEAQALELLVRLWNEPNATDWNAFPGLPMKGDITREQALNIAHQAMKDQGMSAEELDQTTPLFRFFNYNSVPSGRGWLIQLTRLNGNDAEFVEQFVIDAVSGEIVSAGGDG